MPESDAWIALPAGQINIEPLAGGDINFSTCFSLALVQPTSALAFFSFTSLSQLESTTMKSHLLVLLVALATFADAQFATKSKVNYKTYRRFDALSEDNCDHDGSEYRLPRSVTPTHYNLTLFPDLDQLVFSGLVSIAVKINEPNVTKITVHQLELDVTDVQFVAGNKGKCLCNCYRQ